MIIKNIEIDKYGVCAFGYLIATEKWVSEMSGVLHLLKCCYDIRFVRKIIGLTIYKIKKQENLK